MRRAGFFVIGFAVSSCSQADSGATKSLMAQQWSPTTADCGSDYVEFSNARRVFHPKDRPSSQIKVVNIVNNPEYLNNVMVVGDPEDGGGQVAMVFDVSGERLKLVGQGSPKDLHRIGPDNRNAKRFDLVRCPS